MLFPRASPLYIRKKISRLALRFYQPVLSPGKIIHFQLCYSGNGRGSAYALLIFLRLRLSHVVIKPVLMRVFFQFQLYRLIFRLIREDIKLKCCLIAVSVPYILPLIKRRSE